MGGTESTRRSTYEEDDNDVVLVSEAVAARLMGMESEEKTNRNRSPSPGRHAVIFEAPEYPHNPPKAFTVLLNDEPREPVWDIPPITQSQQSVTPLEEDQLQEEENDEDIIFFPPPTVEGILLDLKSVADESTELIEIIPGVPVAEPLVEISPPEHVDELVEFPSSEPGATPVVAAPNVDVSEPVLTELTAPAVPTRVPADVAVVSQELALDVPELDALELIPDVVIAEHVEVDIEEVKESTGIAVEIGTDKIVKPIDAPGELPAVYEPTIKAAINKPSSAEPLIKGKSLEEWYIEVPRTEPSGEESSIEAVIAEPSLAEPSIEAATTEQSPAVKLLTEATSAESPVTESTEVLSIEPIWIPLDAIAAAPTRASEAEVTPASVLALEPPPEAFPTHQVFEDPPMAQAGSRPSSPVVIEKDELVSLLDRSAQKASEEFREEVGAAWRHLSHTHEKQVESLTAKLELSHRAAVEAEQGYREKEAALEAAEAAYGTKLQALATERNEVAARNRVNFDTALKRVDNKYGSLQNGNVCVDARTDVLNCYKANTHTSLNCAQHARDLRACVGQQKERLLGNTG